MKVSIACAVLFLAQLVAADNVVNINEELDKVLVKVNKFLTEKEAGLQRIPPLIYDDIQLLHGVFVGQNSIYRTRDSTVSNHENKTVTLDMHLGLRLYELAFGLIRVNGEEMSGAFSVKNNSFVVNYTIDFVPKCKVTLHRYEYEELTDAWFSSSLPDHSGDVSDVFTKTVLVRINEALAEIKEKIQSGIQYLVCKHPRNGLKHETAALTDIILTTTLQNLNFLQ